MILIADSGSTKTDWCLCAADGAVKATVQTQGINPFHQTEDAIAAILRNELLPQLSTLNTQLSTLNTQHSTLNFYGSGCRPELIPTMERLLRDAFPQADVVEVQGDLLGAARALCGHSEGIACILGTGANSCLYDGQHIVQNTPPLGYILGDEGSGAVLGVRFMNALLKGFLPAVLCADFYRETGLDDASIINKVYRQPMANRFLASMAPFIARHLDCEPLHQLVVDNFRQFFRRNVAQYARPDLPVSAIGSMAYHFRQQLALAAEREGFQLGTVMKSPMEGLVAYHRTN